MTYRVSVRERTSGTPPIGWVPYDFPTRDEATRFAITHSSDRIIGPRKLPEIVADADHTD
jgi:hypothetical protein